MLGHAQHGGYEFIALSVHEERDHDDNREKGGPHYAGALAQRPWRTDGPRGRAW